MAVKYKKATGWLLDFGGDRSTDLPACSSLRFFGLVLDRYTCLAALYEHFPRPAASRITSAVWEMIGVGCVFHARHFFIRREKYNGSTIRKFWRIFEREEGMPHSGR